MRGCADAQNSQRANSCERSYRRENRKRANAAGKRAARFDLGHEDQLFKQRLYLHDLFFFGSDQLIDLFDEAIGRFLKLVLHALVVVLGDVVIFELRAQIVVDFMAHVADGDLAVFALLLTIFTRSLRRSSLSAGIDRRIELPSTLGVRPKSLFSMALRISPTVLRSKAAIIKERGSGTLTVATCLSGTDVP